MDKRGENDIWANMYDLPLMETTDLMEPDALIRSPEMKIFGENVTILNKPAVKKHVLTHQHLYIQFLVLKSFPEKLTGTWFYIRIGDIKNLAMPQRTFIFIKNFFNF